MRPKRSLDEPGMVEALIERLSRVRPDTPRQWGAMTPHEMLCHLADAYEGVLGGRVVSPSGTLLTRTVVKWIALHSTIPWPHGVATRPEVNPRDKGTRPSVFATDQARAIEWLRRFAAADVSTALHPGFGRMSRREWMLWGFGHADHHLRQFGN
ncbi:MAG: DinB family protein [Acidobacteriota bacterium]